MEIHVDISEYDGKTFNTLETLRLEASHIPQKGDIYTSSNYLAYGTYQITNKIVHFEKGKLFSVRLIVTEVDF